MNFTTDLLLTDSPETLTVGIGLLLIIVAFGSFTAGHYFGSRSKK
jgi:hypothetical protein